MRRIALALLLAATPFAPAHADDTMVTLKAEQIGEIFCLSRLGNDEAVIDGILTADLKTAIADADKHNADWEAKNPGDKPPLGDGVPWQSWTDYAAKCATGLVALSKKDAKVEIQYGFPDDPKADFTDTLILKKIDRPDVGPAVWRIDNVAYATGGDLKAALLSAFADQ